ncbi:MAG: hypothetical protein K2K54_13525, partial [Lachnospiraceae bacterium]|nr:hypothetical protein [Lachnospiraceae bacterium]
RRQRQICRRDRYYIEGYKTGEISGILQISESAVKKRLQRGRAMLKVRLGEV